MKEVKPNLVAESLDVCMLGTETDMISVPVLNNPETRYICLSLCYIIMRTNKITQLLLEELLVL